MSKQSFAKMKKALGILVLVSVIMFLTVGNVSASTNQDYQDGYKAGYQAGQKIGTEAGKEDCLKYGKEGVLKKIPTAKVKSYWTDSYKKGYKKGFKKGYVSAYNSVRFECLKK
jgi:hypothetical protein